MPLMEVDEIRRKLARKASLMVVGGFRPPADPFASWFGRVRVALPDEAWPAHSEKPMLPLCQINCMELPYRPAAIADIAFISVFISQGELPYDTPNGEGWMLRNYPTLDHLVETREPDPGGLIKPFPVRWNLCEEDYPCWEDVEIELPPDMEENYNDLCENQEGSKVGGWPSLIQSEIFGHLGISIQLIQNTSSRLIQKRKGIGRGEMPVLVTSAEEAVAGRISGRLHGSVTEAV